jgi:hypothetical protein
VIFLIDMETETSGNLPLSQLVTLPTNRK